MATVVPIGEPVNDAERLAIAHLRDLLPGSYTVFHNFEVRRDGETFEIDIAVLAPHALYLVDVKGTRGLIDVYGPKWYPEGRQPYTSPLMKLRGHARTVKGILTESQPGRRELENVFVEAAILLTAPDANLVDQGNRDVDNVTTLKKAGAFFQNAGRIPARFEKNISRLHGMVRSALVGVAKPRSGPLVLGDWQVVERLGASDTFIEYRAINAFAGKRGGTALLRSYQADPYLTDPDARERQTARIANAFFALNRLPGHPLLAGAKSFFATESEDRYVLVTEDVSGQALRLHIDKPSLALTFDQKLRVARELLEALAFCHRHEVVHRDLSPSTILLGSDGHIRLTGFDHARAGTDRSLTIAAEIVDKVDANYAAPETWKEPANASPSSDVFGAGLVLYELFTGHRPFNSPTELFDLEGVFSVQPSAHRPEIAAPLDAWLQRLCSFEADRRPTAAQALTELAELEMQGDPEQLDGAEFVEQALAITRGELRPLLALVKGQETEQLEFKEAIYNTKELQDVNLADVQWGIVRTLAALANSSGGAILVGVNDDAQPVGLSASDPKRRLADAGGWDEFVRKDLNKALFRGNGWATMKRGTWTIDVRRLATHVVVRRAKLDGVDVLALVVRPCAKGDPILASNRKDRSEPTHCMFVRAPGDKGEVLTLASEEEWHKWQGTRRVRSGVFRHHLERLRDLVAVRAGGEAPPGGEKLDWADVPRGTLLAGKLEVQARLGRGTFGVVYKVVDTLGDVTRALKLILRDRHSTLERLKKEYKTLVHLPEHPHVVRVIDANVLPGDGPPYMLFEHVEGEDVGDLIEDGRFAPEDALVLFRQVAEGLVHLHREGVYHCDIKPHNLLWTVRGAKIIDFNVSVRAEDNGHGGGSRRYLPPDLDLGELPSPSELVDRDLYALGLTVYESLTGAYPWKSTSPPPATAAPDPRELPGFSDLAPELTGVVLKAIAPKRADRFASASALLEALDDVTRARREPTAASSDSLLVPELGDTLPPNTNPFVSYLLTLYSQSPQTNAGTRGLDDLGRRTYVPTLLDDVLMPDVIAGKFKLVLITGNAGDGKTAFLQQLEVQAGEQAELVSSEALLNGRRFKTTQRNFLTNYDGSQDEDTRANDEVLRDFFTPYKGGDPAFWPSEETRLVAINEGRLVDFLQAERAAFPALLQIVDEGLLTGADAHGVAVVNLNLRSVVAHDGAATDSILERQTRLLTHPKFWGACQSCDLKDRCYALHNAQTFQDQTAGPQVLERLKTLYTLTHLRGRLHITLRDLRSALAFMLTSARDCAEIHKLYAEGRRSEIAASFYFNSWMGAESATVDRLLTLLQDVDVGEASDPRLDRSLDFVSPAHDRSRFGFADRGGYDHDVLRALYESLPRDFSGKPMPNRTESHRRYVAMARRRAFFERRDGGWWGMLPYRSGDRMLKMVRRESTLELALPELVQAINRGEGLLDPSRLEGSLALQVRQVERGTIRSYRLYDGSRFRLSLRDGASRARFVEHMPDALVLSFDDEGNQAELVINLDVFEMLERLNHGYRPSLEEEQGYYLSLAVFKNILGSAPYQEVLLTTTGHDFYRVERHEDGRLEMAHVPAHASPSSASAAIDDSVHTSPEVR